MLLLPTTRGISTIQHRNYIAPVELLLDGDGVPSPKEVLGTSGIIMGLIWGTPSPSVNRLKTLVCIVFCMLPLINITNRNRCNFTVLQ